MVSGADHDGRQPSPPCPNATASEADLGTKWEQDWQYQPNAASMYVLQGSILTVLQSKSLSITTTCFQYHEYGRGPGLKIRWGNTRVGSSPTFGIKATSPPNPRKGRAHGRTAAQGGVPRMVPLESRIRRSIPDDDGRLTSALRGLVSNRCASSPAVEVHREGEWDAIAEHPK